MSNSDSKAAGGGIGFCGLLTILFIGLKLTHYIEWTWIWVLSPIWIPFVPVLALGILYLIIQLVIFVLEAFGK